MDTCCIDKSSNAELSEAINSMFKWYQAVKICYVYLEDVPLNENPFNKGSALRKSRWFTRGWTLQELLAPQLLYFFDSSWSFVFPDPDFVETKRKRIHRVREHGIYQQDPRRWSLPQQITSIPQTVLEKKIALSSVAVACKLS